MSDGEASVAGDVSGRRLLPLLYRQDAGLAVLIVGRKRLRQRHQVSLFE